jgi:hypothetical protein
MKTPKIILQFIDWFRALPAWQWYVPLAVIVLLWLALALR